jgi:hypothetical protein
MAGTATLEPVSPRARHRGAAIALTAVFVASLAFVALAALPYFTLDEGRFMSYWERRWWLLLHIGTGMIALLTGPLQLWLGITDRRPSLHRRMGMLYILSVSVSSAAAFYLAFNTDLGWVFGAGLVGLAIAWLVTTWMAFAAIKRQLIDQHKEWMIRSYVVTTAFVAFRIIFPIVQGANVGTLNEQLAFASWAAWALPLVITEAVIQGRKILAVKPV